MTKALSTEVGQKTLELAKQKNLRDIAVDTRGYTFKQFSKDCGDLTIAEARDRAYRGLSSLVNKNTPLGKEFLNQLKKAGYTAVVDEDDAGYGQGFTNTPTILLDNSALNKTKSTPMNINDTKALDREYENYEWSREKHFNNYITLLDSKNKRAR